MSYTSEVSLRATLCVATVWAVLVGSDGCSNEGSPLPPALGSCRPTPDAGCAVSAGGNVSGGGPSVGGGTTQDSGLVDGSLTGVPVGMDAGSCGAADLMLVARTQNPNCGPCIVVGPGEAGALNCCAADMACSADPGCLAIVQYALGSCAGSGSCVSMFEMTSALASVQGYGAFAQCIAQFCTPQCPTLPQGTVGDI